MESLVVDTTHSPYAELKPVPVTAVQLKAGFWKARIERNWQKAIPRLFELLESHGILDNFRRLYGAYNGPRRGYYFSDSDLYKWMEAAALALQAQEIPGIRSLLERAIETILPAQGEDGYLNTWFALERKDKRWGNLNDSHELYCAGHLIQAAIAHHRLTGATHLLDCATRFADYIDETFRLKPRPGSPDHPEIEMALVELYRLRRNRRHLDLARYFLDQRGVAGRAEFWGHAVRAAYFMAGAADYYLESGYAPYLQAIESQWHDMLSRKMYITGGIGGRHSGESLGIPYELPNERAYAETCAAIGSILWNWRMLQMDGDARYSDCLERTLYNGFLAGVSLSGDEYFYVNPLADSGLEEEDPWYEWARSGPAQRKPWYDCTCCPPNVQRLLASLPAHFYSTSSQGLWVHLFDASEMSWRLQDGAQVSVVQETSYPWSGEIDIKVWSDSPEPFTLFVRIPAWARQASAVLNGGPIAPVEPGKYLQVRRVWSGERLHISLDLPVQMMTSDDRVPGNRGSVALQRGPLVYCLEGIDHHAQDVRHFYLQSNPQFEIKYEAGLLDGVTTIAAGGFQRLGGDAEPLYRPISEREVLRWVEGRLKFIPYYAWANRGPTSMAVWLPLNPISLRPGGT